MDKEIQSVKKFVMDKKNRTTIIAVAAVFAIVAGIVTAKRGKKRK